ncbi:MAG: penicillin-binding transpeptidase domain-containing protein, partial [Bacteroidota bacterium]
MDRSFIIKLLVVVVALSFVARLFYLQLIDDHYKQAAETNVVQKIVDYPYRGLIYDRNDSLVVYNSPVFDLMVIPKEAVITDTLAFCELLEIEKEDLEERLMKARSYSTILASKLVEQVSDEVFARLQDQLVHYPGFYVLPRTIRSYTTSSLANVLGYIGEVNTSYLENDTSDYYRPGDFLGIGGIEKSYEAQLRGKRGATFKVVDVKGKIKDAYREGTYDTLPKPGANIKLTIDLDLQEYAEKLMEGKVGSLVAIEPKSGEILAFVSAPSYDPQLLSGKELSENFPELSQDPDKPLFNRPLQARYPPGSMFKTIQGVIALHE